MKPTKARQITGNHWPKVTGTGVGISPDKDLSFILEVSGLWVIIISKNLCELTLLIYSRKKWLMLRVYRRLSCLQANCHRQVSEFQKPEGKLIKSCYPPANLAQLNHDRQIIPPADYSRKFQSLNLEALAMHCISFIKTAKRPRRWGAFCL